MGITRHRFSKGVSALVSSKVIAASDSTTEGKTNADYVCNGDNDQVTINTAIAELTSGGKVLLLEGTYKIQDAICIEVANITLTGVGRATILEAYGAVDFDGPGTTIGVISANGIDNLIIKDLQIDCSNTTAGNQEGISFFDCSYCTISNLYIHDTYDANGISFNATTDTQIKHNKIVGNILETISGYAINLINAQYCIVSGNIIDSSSIAVLLSNLGVTYPTSHTVVEGNTITNIDSGSSGNEGIYVSQYSTNNAIVGNTIHSGPDFSVGIGTYAEHTLIKGNSIKFVGYGIYVNNLANYCLIAGNHLFANQDDGITITAGHCSVVDNVVVGSGQSVTDTYSNIDIGGANADYNNIQGNLCRIGSLFNESKYGIFIEAATCVNNIVRNNDLYLSGNTADFQDDGVGTLVTSSNRT